MSDQNPIWRRDAGKISLLIYVFLAAFNVCGVALATKFRANISFEANIFGPLTLICGVIALWFQLQFKPSEEGKKDPLFKANLRAFIGVFIFGAVVELCGVILGIPFGHYRYSGLWFPVVPIGIYGYFPLLIPLAWILIPGGWALFAGSKWKFGPAVLIAATGSMLTDFIMEPALVEKLHYWSWIYKSSLPGGASLANPFGWWVCSAIVAVILLQNRPKARQTALAIPLIHLAMIVLIGALIPA